MSIDSLQRSLKDHNFTLGLADIHCWVFSLDQSLGADWLDTDERKRAARFHFDIDRQRFVSAHMLIRILLAQYLPTARGDLRIDRNEFGRPYLKDFPLNFNYSRTEGWGLIAVARCGILGADLETLNAADDLLDVALQNFSPAENAELDGLAGEEWTQGFFNGWTRKEAIVKAAGVGLGMPLDSFDVSLTPGAAPLIHRAAGPAEKCKNWTLRSFSPVDGLCAAIASNITEPQLEIRKLAALK